MVGTLTFDKLVYDDPTGTMFGNIGHMLKNAYEGTIDNAFHRIDNAITETRESIHSVISNTKGVISKFPNPFSVLYNKAKAIALGLNGAADLAGSAGLGIVHGAEVLYHEGIDTIQGGVHAIRGLIRNSIGRIPAIGRVINPIAKLATATVGMVPTAIARIPASVTTWLREHINTQRTKVHDKVRDIFAISTDTTAANDDREQAAPAEAAA